MVKGKGESFCLFVFGDVIFSYFARGKNNMEIIYD